MDFILRRRNDHQSFSGEVVIQWQELLPHHCSLVYRIFLIYITEKSGVNPKEEYMDFLIIDEDTGSSVEPDKLKPKAVYQLPYIRKTTGGANFENPVTVKVDDDLDFYLRELCEKISEAIKKKNLIIKEEFTNVWKRRKAADKVVEDIKALKKAEGIARWNKYGESFPAEYVKYTAAEATVAECKEYIKTRYAELFPVQETEENAFNAAFFRALDLKGLRESVERAPKGADYVFTIRAYYCGSRIDYRTGSRTSVWLKADQVTMEEEIAAHSH